LRSQNKALARGEEMLKRALLYSPGWGSEEFADLARSYYQELAGRARSLARQPDGKYSYGEKHRILWAYLWDYTDPHLLRYLENDLQCSIVAEEMNHLHWPEIDLDQPFEGLARRIVQPINHLDDRANYLQEMAEKHRVDGIIVFIHFFAHCPLASESFQNMMRKSDYPILFIEGDCLDKSRQPSSTLTKLQAFIEQLNEMKYGNVFGAFTDQKHPQKQLLLS